MRLIVLLLITAAYQAADTPPKTGRYSTTFDERHPESAHDRMAKRYDWGKLDPAKEYRISEESFDIQVPAGYDGSQAWGLIVYTNSGKGGSNGSYSDLLSKHRLIWIGAANVPNERDIYARWGLALDAAWNMSKRYRIDPKRIYTSGSSGGGRCASMVAPTYPDVFTGGIYLIGCNQPVLPDDKLLKDKALKQHRYAMITGDKDFNLQDTKSVADAYRAAGFAFVEFLQEPGLGHNNPSGPWFEKGIIAVDTPLLAEAQALLAEAQARQERKPYEAANAYRHVVTNYPIADAAVATARKQLEILTPRVDADLRAEFAKLDGATKDKLRAFAKRAAGFPVESEARQSADALAATELAAIQTGPAAGQSGKLAKFLEEWAGYPSAIAALTAYDALCAAALEPLRDQPAAKRGKALLKIIKDWLPCPARSAAADLLEADLAPELATIEAIEKPQTRGTKLVAFAKAWPGTAAGAKAERLANELLASLKK